MGNLRYLLVDEFEVGGVDADGGGLADEIEAEKDEEFALAFFDVALHAAEGAGDDADAFADSDVREGGDFVVGFEGSEDGVELILEGLLVGNVEEIRDVIALVHFFALVREEVEENVVREQRFFERDGFAGIFFDALKERKCGLETFARAEVS